VGKLTVIAFVLGVGFSGMLTMTARSRRLAELSVPRVAARGGAALASGGAPPRLHEGGVPVGDVARERTGA
jgi:hypothetical protein